MLMLALIGLTVFLSAFLLFCSEPMVGKMVLPVLGGAAAVWTTCVLFFQSMLLAGYLYTHLLGKQRRLRTQLLVHFLIITAALAFLPIRFGADASASASQAPVTWLFGHLLVSFGIPFAAISATAPLLQNWLSRTRRAEARDPYFLYALSNAGSLAALIAYPLIFEPRFGVTVQSRYWSHGYALLFVLVAVSALLIRKDASGNRPEDVLLADITDTPSWRIRGFWLAAAFVPSALMLAVTTHLTLNIAPAPLLWVIPLAVYLLTFIVAFSPGWRRWTTAVSGICTLVILLLSPLAAGIPIHSGSIWMVMCLHLLILFFGSLLCHSALSYLRPSPQFLTEFYFVLALGGVLGGVFASIVAPSLFRTIIEYPLLVGTLMFFRRSAARGPARRTDAIAVAAYLAFVDAAIRLLKWSGVDASYFTLSLNWNEISRDDWIVAATGLLMLLALLLFRRKPLSFALCFASFVLALAIEVPRQYATTEVVHVNRNFFGVKKVTFDEADNTLKLLHGDTLHGLESLAPDSIGEPLFYYYRGGAFSDVMHILDGRARSRVAVVGLGAGTIGAYAGPQRHITFIDIDPQMVDIARDYFTFLTRCGNNCDVIVGDGRLAIEAQPAGVYDLIVLDAFNSDSVPAHLVSREAVRMYVSKLAPGGVLLFHVSNRYLDVRSLAAAVALDEGLRTYRRPDDDYIAAAKHEQDVTAMANRDQWQEMSRPPDLRSWTDDYSNVVRLIRWGSR
jgi:SAM-dependent methyltransferase